MRTNTFKLQASCNEEFVAALPNILQQLHPSLVPLCFQGEFPGLIDNGNNATAAAAATATADTTAPLLGCSEAFELLPLNDGDVKFGAKSDGDLPTFGRHTQGTKIRRV